MGDVHVSVVAMTAVLLSVAAYGTLRLLRVRRLSDRELRHPAWPYTRGTVLSATVQMSHTARARHESPLVLYAYQVDGQMFQGHRVRSSGACPNASEVIARYPAGASVVVYYDPADPANSALER